jgi:glutaredoxin
VTEEKELVVYSRTWPCPYQNIAYRVFEKYNVPFREIYINQDDDALARVEDWTGYRSVPTMIIARRGEDLPYEEPAPLARGSSPRGVDRGSMLTEATENQLVEWLQRHGFAEAKIEE